MKKHIAIVFLAHALGSAPALAADGEAAPGRPPLENLTLESALEIAEDTQPQIAEAEAWVEAAGGRARQAGAFPNPEAILGAQQVSFSGAQAGGREYVAGVGQAVPLGRRLSKAREVELLDREVRTRGVEVKRREIRKRVQNAFATALYQEKAWQAQSGIQGNAASAVAAARARFEAGDIVRDDLARAEMGLAGAKVESLRTESLRGQALLELASAMGDATLVVRSLAGSLDLAFELPALESLVANLPAQPENALAEADLRARRARVDWAKAERIPDVKVEVLYHRLEATGADTMDVGLSIPLPLFTRNQGRLREARAEQAAAEARARATRNELNSRLRESYARLAAALASARTMRTEILDQADTVLKTAEARYAAGDIGLVEVLPIRRDWAAIQLSYLESLRETMRAWAEVKSLQ